MLAGTRGRPLAVWLLWSSGCCSLAEADIGSYRLPGFDRIVSTLSVTVPITSVTSATIIIAITSISSISSVVPAMTDQEANEPPVDSTAIPVSVIIIAIAIAAMLSAMFASVIISRLRSCHNGNK